MGRKASDLAVWVLYCFPKVPLVTGSEKLFFFGVSFAIKSLEQEVMKFKQYKHPRLGFKLRTAVSFLKFKSSKYVLGPVKLLGL